MNSHQQQKRLSVASQPHQHLVESVCCTVATLTGVQWYLIFVLFSIPECYVILSTFSSAFFAICVSSLVQCLFIFLFFCSFKKIGCFLHYYLNSSLNILDRYHLLPNKYFAKIFLTICDLYSHFLKCLSHRIVFTVMKSNLPIYY